MALDRARRGEYMKGRGCPLRGGFCAAGAAPRSGRRRLRRQTEGAGQGRGRIECRPPCDTTPRRQVPLPGAAEHEITGWGVRAARRDPAAGAALIAFMVLAPDAMAGFITPKTGGSPNAEPDPFAVRVVLYLAAFVFVVVEGALIYSIRVPAKKNAVAAQIHGNTGSRSAGRSAAAGILLVLTVVTFIKLPASSTRRTRTPTAWCSRPRSTSRRRPTARSSPSASRAASTSGATPTAPAA